MQVYIDCLERIRDTRMHRECRELSGEYLQYRMDRCLMAREDLETLGYSADQAVEGPANTIFLGGFVAGDAPCEGIQVVVAEVDVVKSRKGQVSHCHWVTVKTKAEIVFSSWREDVA
jgi:hypothetical protein